MKLKWLINSTAIALLIIVAFVGLARHDSVMAAQDESNKIEGLLLDRFTADGSADFIVRFTEQADLSPAYSMDWNARGEFVYNTLHDTAYRSQANAKAILDERGLSYQIYIAGNDLYVVGGTLAVANDLAALPGVNFIRATRTYYIDPVVEVKPLDNISWAGDFLANRALTTVGSSTDATTDWGITDTKADQFWTTFGDQGDGIVVANIDTGVQWNHPALINQFKCPGDPTNPACWKDPSNICGVGGACDNNGHGSHTMGTMVADNDPALTYIAGMAPNAKWIACKGCESTSCSDSALNSCADWILAPNSNPANRPNIVNNSWGGNGGDNWYQAKVQAWVAAGIFPAFSAGNSGQSGCTTLGSPGDYQESFATAAHDSTRAIAYFSSRGPSAFGHDPYTKPNLSSPGVSICSTIPTNNWSCGYSGTSMASPHTAGAVALLWSCNASLVGQINQTFQILQNNTDSAPAGNCGAPPDGQGNYTYGYGYLDILNAGMAACSGITTGTLQGHVYDKGGNPISGANVAATLTIEGDQIQATTDPTGFYTMDLIVGTYSVIASKVGYASQTVNGIAIAEGVTTIQDFNLTSLEPDIVVTAPPLDAIQPPDTITSSSVEICNLGVNSLDWYIAEVPPAINKSAAPTITPPTQAIVNSMQSDSVTQFEGVLTQVGTSLQGSAGKSGFGHPEAILWDNGPLITHPGGGYNGANASALQTALGLSTYGFGQQFSYGYRMADDFVIAGPGSWNIQQITFFAYQSSAPVSPSPITGVYYQIWNGPPNNPASSVVFGDLVTNRLASSNFTNIYRVLDTGLTNHDRGILANVANAGVVLPSGTYWLEWMIDGNSSYSGPWAPPISILGQTTTGNAMQYTTSWAPALDGGTATQQGMPFVIEGLGFDIPWLSESPVNGTISGGGCSTVDITFDSTSLSMGKYIGGFQIHSNDPDEPVVTMPVSLTVGFRSYLPLTLR
jgi:hypothetical protein